MPVKPVLRHVARQGMWPSKACSQARHVAKQGMWPSKACSQARHVANIDRQIKRDSCLLSYDGRTLSEWKLHTLGVPGVLKGVSLFI
jgi:hypothetical protein